MPSCMTTCYDVAMATTLKSFRMDERLAPKLAATAERVDRSESWVINRALEMALEGPDTALARAVGRDKPKAKES